MNYFGITGQHDTALEELGWMARRGKMKHDGTFSKERNVPVLAWANGKRITLKQCREELGCMTQIVSENPYYYNACRIEAMLQRYYQHTMGCELPRRTWKVAGAGGTKYYLDVDQKLKDSPRSVKVFRCWSTLAYIKLQQGLIKVIEKKNDRVS